MLLTPNFWTVAYIYIYETKVYHDHRHPFVLHSIEMATVAIEVQQLMNQSLEALMDVSKAINLQ